MAVGLLLFVLFTGSTVFLLRAIVETFDLYITNLLSMAFWNDTLARYSSEGCTVGKSSVMPSNIAAGINAASPV